MFQLDKNMAIEGAAAGGGITESGAYTGKIVKAETFQSSIPGSQACGVEFTFERVDGARARYLQVYEKKADGGDAFGLKQIHAIMACMKIRGINQLNDFCHPVGLILQREDYQNSAGEEKYKFQIIAPFNAQTRQTADELLNGKPAVTVDKIVETLVDKKAKPRTNQGGNQAAANQGYQQYSQPQGNQPQGNSAAVASNGAPVFDDDIPF